MESLDDYRFLKLIHESLLADQEFFYVFNQCIDEGRAPWVPGKKAYIAQPSDAAKERYAQNPYKIVKTAEGDKQYRKSPPKEGFQGALLHGDDNSKIAKGLKKGYLSLILNLSPAEESGFNLCSCRTSGCALACLHLSGSPVYQKGKMQARLGNTFYLVKQREKFVDQLISEINLARQYAKEQKLKLAIRLNGTSDLPWESPAFGKGGRSIMDMFPDVQFYDYTKVPGRVKQFVNKKMPANYHLTFSYSEKPTNQAAALEALRAGMNVAIVFGPGKAGVLEKLILPQVWGKEGFRVMDGDDSDLRFTDPKDNQGRGMVVGLRAKADAAWDYDKVTPQHIKVISDLFTQAGTKTPLVRTGFSAEAQKVLQTNQQLFYQVLDILRADAHKSTDPRDKGTGFVVQPEDPSVDPRMHPENYAYVYQGVEKKLIRAFNGVDKREVYRKMRQDFFAKHSNLYKDYLKRTQEFCKQHPEECEDQFGKIPVAQPDNPLAQHGIGIKPDTLQQIGIIRRSS